MWGAAFINQSNSAMSGHVPRDGKVTGHSCLSRPSVAAEWTSCHTYSAIKKKTAFSL